jgi:hypothetical protein
VAPAATAKEPATDPDPEIEHRGLEMILLGEDEIVHEPASPAAKLEPDTNTLVPGRPEVGFNVTEGSSVKGAVAESNWADVPSGLVIVYPRTVTVWLPVTDAGTLN